MDIKKFLLYFNLSKVTLKNDQFLFFIIMLYYNALLNACKKIQGNY